MRTGDLGLFIGYNDNAQKADPRFFIGDLFVVAAVEADGPMICFPVDHWGRVFSWRGETLFPEEVMPLSYAKIPTRRLPPPYGIADNELAMPSKAKFIPKSAILRAAKYAAKHEGRI